MDTVEDPRGGGAGGEGGVGLFGFYWIIQFFWYVLSHSPPPPMLNTFVFLVCLGVQFSSALMPNKNFARYVTL